MKEYTIVYEFKGKKEIMYVPARNPQNAVDKCSAIYIYKNFPNCERINILTVAEIVGGWEQKTTH